MAEEFKNFRPFYNIPDTSKPYSVSGNLTLLAPANSVLSNYLSDTSEEPQNDTISAKLRYIEL